MTAQILDGKAISAELRIELQSTVASLTQSGARAPCLAVVLVGEDPASQVYVRNKEKACEQVGIRSLPHRLSPDTSEAALIELVDTLNAADDVDGILVQLPLPAHVDADRILDRIDPTKDVDGFHPSNIGRLLQRRPGLRPCTPYGVMKMLERTQMPVAGKRAVVVGASNIVGRPMAMELLLANATVTICNSKTRDLAAEVQRAEIVVAGIGIPEFVRGEWIADGAVVIDVGINRLDNGKLVGDVEFAAAAKRASWITPVPGGVGPMTIAMLLHNTVQAYQARNC
ncbi:MAG: bifunctional methylenetetrahydrofolate dehydrogenase/methenyltetrahydrofolate cyclohydrolase FolD [Oceanococcus sp.]